MKRCGKCELEKPDEAFPLVPATSPKARARGVRYRCSPCRECRNANTRRWYAAATERCLCGQRAAFHDDGFPFCRACFAALQA